MDGAAFPPLPPRFAAWFERRGWAAREHQLEMVAEGRAGRHALLIAPTGGGKTLAGFLPSLIELAERPPRNTPSGVHTLYISPLKALAVDVERNLMTPILEMGLPIVAESRTGDTGISRRQRQRVKPPDILLTTPDPGAAQLVGRPVDTPAVTLPSLSSSYSINFRHSISAL